MDADDAKITIVFRGVRGSHPMPGPSTIRFGGNTTSQELRVGGRLLVFDAGTGIISLGDDLIREGGKRHIAVFFSHNHHDHTDGILYFKPAYDASTTMHIFGPVDRPGSILDALENLSSPAAHPVPLTRMGMHFNCAVLGDGDVVRWAAGDDAPAIVGPGTALSPDDVVVKVMKNNLHPLEGVLNFRLEYAGRSYVYATDVEGDEEHGDPRLAQFAKGADLMSHDGQYTSEEYQSSKRGWGHSTIAMAIRTARMAGVKRLAIIHHEPAHSDDQLEAMESKVQADCPEIFLAREGQTVRL